MVYLKHDIYSRDTPFWSETLDIIIVKYRKERERKNEIDHKRKKKGWEEHWRKQGWSENALSDIWSSWFSVEERERERVCGVCMCVCAIDDFKRF